MNKRRQRKHRYRRFWRRLSSLLWTAAFLVLVSAAVLTGVGRLLAPYADRITPQLNSYLSQQLGAPVNIDQLAAGWDGLQPHLALQDVVIGNADEALHLNQVRLQFDPLTWFQSGRNSVRMEILGADLELNRSTAGRWSLMGQGLDSGAGSNEQQLQNITALLERADVQLVDARIRLLDELNNYQRVFDLPRVSIAQVPQRTTGGVESDGRSFSSGGAGSVFQMIARVQPDGDPDAEAILRLMVQAGSELHSVLGYFHSQQQALQPWLTLLPEEWLAVNLRAASASTDSSLPADLNVDVDTELWFDWARDQALKLTGHLQLSGTDQSAEALSAAPFMATDLLAKIDRDEWAVTLDNLAFEKESLSSTWLEAGSNVGNGWSLAAGVLPMVSLQHWQQWLLPDAGVPLAVQGELEKLTVALDEQGRILLAEANANDVYIDIQTLDVEATNDELNDASGRETVLCGPLQLQLGMQDQFGQLSINSEAGLCEVAGFTRQPYLLEQLQLSLQLEQHGGDWLATWLPSYWDSGDFRLELGGQVALRDAGLWLNMHVGIDEILATQVKHYLPYQEQPKGARDWISRAMKGGYWRDIRASIRGGVKNWPITPDQGQFAAAVKLDDATLQYGRNWPPATQVNGHVDMLFDGLQTRNARANIGGVPVSNLNVSISELKEHPVLDLNAKMIGDASAVLDLLAVMPLGGTSGLADREFELTGPVAIDAELGLDLKQRSRLIYADGVAQLNNVDAQASLLQVGGINGQLGFDDVGIKDSQLQANWGGHASQVRWMRTTAGPEIHLQGQYPAEHILNTALPDQPMVHGLMSGNSDWLLRLLISRDLPRVILQSDLMGTEMRLPAPLEKFAAASQAIEVDWELGDGERNIGIDYADILQLRMRQNQTGEIAGATAQFLLPNSILAAPHVSNGKVLLTGQTELFDPLGWMSMFAGLSTELDDDQGSAPEVAPSSDSAAENIVNQELPEAGQVSEVSLDGTVTDELIPEMHLNTQQLLIDRRVMGKTQLDYSQQLIPDGAGGTEMQRLLTLEGDSVSGEVTFAVTDHNWVIDTNLQRLDVPKPLISSNQPSGREMLIEERAPIEDEQRIDWLTLHLICDDLTWHGIPLGQTRIEILPNIDGMVIDTLEARSEVLTLTGGGGWRRSDEGITSTLNLRLDADDTGDLLEAMGYERLVEGSQLTLALDSSWPGSIGEINLKKMDGKLTLEAGPGIIPKAAPGAGRVLGLISLQALPRRLFLDFSDVFADGLDFDHADGTLIFHAGIARTSGIVIDAAAAEITITGETDLIRGEYDQLISVKPGFGVALPIIGALAGGPIGVGAGFALQGLIGGLTDIKYQVTGPWAEPELRALSDEPTVTQLPEEELSLNGSPNTSVDPIIDTALTTDSDDDTEPPQETT